MKRKGNIKGKKKDDEVYGGEKNEGPLFTSSPLSFARGKKKISLQSDVVQVAEHWHSNRCLEQHVTDRSQGHCNQWKITQKAGQKNAWKE